MKHVLRAMTLFLFLSLLMPSLNIQAQSILTGRLLSPRHEGSQELVPQTAIFTYGSLAGTGKPSLGFRTFETYPSGWYRLNGGDGRYALLFSSPARHVRPLLLTNVFTQPGQVVERDLMPNFEFASFDESAWEEVAGTNYFQTFTAKGTGITHVGFKLAHDGIDGEGPEGQTLLISIHKQGAGAPDTWEQVGPATPVFVDCGGVKGYSFSVGWNSGEVPTTPGETYAVQLRAEIEGNRFQPFWRRVDNPTHDTYRIGPDGAGYAGAQMWMVVGGDSDGLLIPYNKRIHKEFVEFALNAPKWSQTYVAQGRGLAAPILYMALDGTQPGLHRQRCAIRVRQGGPDGPVVGIEKIATGSGNYTGDASWGTFSAVFAPGEVNLTPGETYAIEFEMIETRETLSGFVNFKGQVNTETPGMTPYRKVEGDEYAHGTAYLNGVTAQDYNLDMQIIEYANPGDDWAFATDDENLLVNGDMQAGELVEGNTDASSPDVWERFSVDPATSFWYLEDEDGNRYPRVIGGSINNTTVDGGYVQRVEGLRNQETYRLSGSVRSSQALDMTFQTMVGFDPSGQTDDPEADSIVWTNMPDMHAFFMPYLSDPIRPQASAISVWLRGRALEPNAGLFEADFDDFQLRRVLTTPPTAGL